MTLQVQTVQGCGDVIGRVGREAIDAKKTAFEGTFDVRKA